MAATPEGTKNILRLVYFGFLCVVNNFWKKMNIGQYRMLRLRKMTKIGLENNFDKVKFGFVKKPINNREIRQR